MHVSDLACSLRFTALTVLLIVLDDDLTFHHKEALRATGQGTPQWERQILGGRNHVGHLPSARPSLLFGQCDCKSLREYGDNRKESLPKKFVVMVQS